MNTRGAAASQPAFVPEELAVSFDRESLARYLAGVELNYDPAQPIRQFASGLANRNYLIEIGGDLAVLRRPPDGDLPPGAHDMAREHRIMSALSPILPFVPRAIHFCADRTIIGAPFQIIEYRAGIVIRGSDLSTVAAKPDAPELLCRNLLDVMIALHATDAQAAGLGELGRPEGFLARNAKNWIERARRMAGERPVAHLIDEIGRWLSSQKFRERAPTLLHSDPKLDNLILDPQTLQVRAVVDWDMGTRGDPLFDLATLLSYWAEPNDPDCMIALDQMPTAKPGFWSRQKVIDYYAARTSRAVDDIGAIRVLAMLKLGVIFLQLHQQWVTGAVQDARYARFAELGESLLSYTRDLAKGAAS